MRSPVAVRIALVVAVIAPVVVLGQAGNQKPSDLAGVWTRAGGEGAGPMSQWSGKPLPFSPAGLAKFNANRPGKGPRQRPPALGNDPIGDANPPGLYRTLIYNRPFEMIQLPDRVLQIFEWGKTWRVIWTDGRAVPEEVVAGPYWYGYSVGKWEGDTLVAQTVGLDSRAWLDEWGTPFTDEARIEERWRRGNANTLELTITVHDAELYAQPFVSDRKTYRLQPKGSAGAELLEQIFAPIDEKEFNERIRNPAAGVQRP
jgi:hypothetical protein